WQVGPVGHPDGAVLEAVHGVLLGDRLGVDVTHAVLPGAAVVAAGRRVRLVPEHAGLVFALVDPRRVALPVVDQALDAGDALLPRALVGLLEHRDRGDHDDQQGNHTSTNEQDDRAPVASLADPDRRHRPAPLAALAGGL